jgi:glucokinase
MTNLILAADIGGTKTLVGAFERGGSRPRRRVARSYSTLDYPRFRTSSNSFSATRPSTEKRLTSPASASLVR